MLDHPQPDDDSIAVLLSGGMDSATLYYEMLYAGWKTLPICVDYGQRHSRELRAAQMLVERAQARWPDLAQSRVVLDLASIGHQLVGSSQTDPTVAVPHGHYADDNMKLTVVPNRNMILLAAAAGVASSRGIKRLAYGAHAGDHAIYPDCRPVFVERMAAALAVCHYFPIILMSPYQDITKVGILQRGTSIGVPYDATWTCYEGGEQACGKCGSCGERLEAFTANKISDPVVYASAS